MNMRKTGILSALIALALTACGGGDDSFVGGTGGTGGTGGGGGGTTGATPASLSLSASANSIPADGSADAEIRALVRDSNNVVISNVPVTLSSSSGALSSGSVATGTDGLAKATLTTGGDSTARNIVVTAKAASFTSTVTIAVGAAPSATPVAALTLQSSAPQIPSDGSSNATIVAIARDANNLLMAGVPVAFTSTSGGLAITQGITDNNGQATATLSTAGDSTPRNITVSASAGGKNATTSVAVATNSSSTTVNMGNGSGSGFVPNVLGIAVPSLSAGGSTSITVSIVRQDGTLFNSPATINFNSPCVASGKAQIQPSATAVTTTGQATVTYSSVGCSGADQVTATSSIGSQALSASGTVTVAAATVGSIVYVSATPTGIALKGTGSTARPETSTVVFRVRDQAGGPVSGAQVQFSLSTTVGGITLTSSTATSDTQGNVQAIVNAGTVATPVTVSAVVTGVSGIGTQSTQLTISTGIPTAGSFSLAVSCNNIEGWDYDGTIATVTARLADRFSNPAPDGTAVSFQAEGGSILPQCQTSTNANEGGVCSVDFRSSNPRPTDGRISLLATAIGEESFVDANGNGVFDTGVDAFGTRDLGEPYLDVNENGAYDLGEPFYDFYNNGGSELGIRNGPDTLFNGVLCTGALCPTDPLKRSAGIGASNTIILSGTTPTVSISTAAGGGVFSNRTMAQSSAITIDLWVRDLHGNPMPGGTTVAGSVSGAGLQVSLPNTNTGPCSTLGANTEQMGITRFQFVVTSGTTTGTGSFTLTVTTPTKKVATTFTITIGVT
jgi:hypothetical protein